MAYFRWENTIILLNKVRKPREKRILYLNDDLKLIIQKYPESYEKLNIYPIGDTQIGSAHFNEKLFRNWIKRVESDPNSAVVIIGDMLNNGLRNSKTNVYGEVMNPSDAKKFLIQALKPISNKIIGCVTGNHELRSVHEVDSDPLYDIMMMLDKDEVYRRNMAFMKVNLGRKSNERQISYTLCLAHGVSKNKTEQFGFTVDNMDIMVTGHIHSPMSRFPAKYVIDTHNEVVRRVGFTHVVVPSFDEHGGYSLRGLYTPQSSNKIPIIVLNGTKKGVDIIWTDETSI